MAMSIYDEELYMPQTILFENFNTPSGYNQWSFYAHPNASATSYLKKVSPVNYEVRTYIQDTGDKAWHIHRKRKGILLVQGERYRIRFKAKTEAGKSRTINIRIEEDGGDYTGYCESKIFTLNDEMREFTHEFTMKEITDANAVFSFEMGRCTDLDVEALDVYFDNISVEKLNYKSPIFAEYFDYKEERSGFPTYSDLGWDFYVDGNAAAVSSVCFHNNNLHSHSNVFDEGTTGWHVNLSKAGISLEQGKTYELRFKASVSGVNNKAINVILEENGGNWTNYSNSPTPTYYITPNEKTYTHRFTMNHPTDRDALLYFGYGKVGTTSPPFDLFLDDIELYVVE